MTPVPRAAEPVTYLTQISAPMFDDGTQRLHSRMLAEPEDEPGRPVSYVLTPEGEAASRPEPEGDQPVPYTLTPEGEAEAGNEPEL